eukprot:5801621-Pyramimonas_sp.AAC.1
MPVTGHAFFRRWFSGVTASCQEAANKALQELLRLPQARKCIDDGTVTAILSKEYFRGTPPMSDVSLVNSPQKFHLFTCSLVNSPQKVFESVVRLRCTMHINNANAVNNEGADSPDRRFESCLSATSSKHQDGDIPPGSRTPTHDHQFDVTNSGSNSKSPLRSHSPDILPHDDYRRRSICTPNTEATRLIAEEEERFFGLQVSAKL